jgi:hypothetical protein
MNSFEAAFRIPPIHRLEQVKTRARGGIVQGMYWEHREYDTSGSLVARYESFQELAVEVSKCRSEWRKYDRTGQLVGVGRLATRGTRTCPFDEG